MPDLDFKIGVQLHDRFTAAAKKMGDTTDRVQKKLLENQKKLNQIGSNKKLIRNYKDLETAVTGTKQKLVDTRSDVQKAYDAIKKAGREGRHITKKQRTEYERLRKTEKRLSDQHVKQKTKLAGLNSRMKEAKIDTRNLASEQDRLGLSFHKLNKKMQAVSAQQERMNKIQSNFDKSLARAAGATLVGQGMSSFGGQALGLLNKPMQSMRAVERSKGDLMALGITDTDAIVKRGQELQAAYAYIDTASFTAAAYDIRSGIDGLSDSGVADVTEQAALVAKATKGQVGEMTSLFATSFGIFKEAQFAGQSNAKFAETFGASLAASVQKFKTDGSKMQQAIESMGGGLTKAGVAMNEQMAALGMLQATMTAGQAGTALKSVAENAAQADERFKKSGINVDVLDADGNMKGLADILDSLQAQYGDDLSSSEQAEIQDAFGSSEATKFFIQMWGQADKLRENNKQLDKAAKAGKEFTDEMAKATDNNWDARMQKAQQRFELVSQKFGYAMLPMIEMLLPVAEGFANIAMWVAESSGFGAFLVGAVGGLGLLAAGLGPIVTGFASLTVASKWLSKTFTQMGARGQMNGMIDGFGDGGGKRRRGKKGMFGKLGKLGKFGKRIPVLGAALSLGSAASTLADDDISGDEKGSLLSGDLGGAGGALAGAAAGAALGSFVPVIGTVIGGAVGGILGGLGGEWAGSSLWDAFSGDSDSKDTPATETAKKAVAEKAGATPAADAKKDGLGLKPYKPIMPQQGKIDITNNMQPTVQIIQQAGEDSKALMKRAKGMVKELMDEEKRKAKHNAQAQLYGT